MPRLVDHEYVQEQIYLSARRQMARCGIEQVSLRAIAGELKMTPPALYYYFKSRDALLERVARDGCAWRLDTLIGFNRKRAPWDRLVAWLAEDEAVMVEQTSALLQLCAIPPLARIALPKVKDSEDALAAVLGLDAASGSLLATVLHGLLAERCIRRSRGRLADALHAHRPLLTFGTPRPIPSARREGR